VAPSFNLSVELKNPNVPDATAIVTVMGVQISEWSYAMPEDDYVLEQVTFRGLWVKTEDKG
jgi:hypothetical protein